MKTLVVGGAARDVGKTAVAAGLIAALAHRNWTAVKITHFGDDERAVYGDSCRLEEERDRGATTDSSRFLAAGARRSFWLRAPAGKLAEALPALRQAVAGAENLIIESNSILRFLHPDLYLMVLGPAGGDWKASAREFFDRADAYILVGEAARSGEPLRKPSFQVLPGVPLSAELVVFVETALAGC